MVSLSSSPESLRRFLLLLLSSLSRSRSLLSFFEVPMIRIFLETSETSPCEDGTLTLIGAHHNRRAWPRPRVDCICTTVLVFHTSSSGCAGAVRACALRYYKSNRSICMGRICISLFNRLLRACLMVSRPNLCTSITRLIREFFTLFSNSVFTPVGSNRYCDRGKYTMKRTRYVITPCACARGKAIGFVCRRHEIARSRYLGI